MNKKNRIEELLLLQIFNKANSDRSFISEEDNDSNKTYSSESTCTFSKESDYEQSLYNF